MDLPETIPCDYCLTNEKIDSPMKLCFINFNEAVYICDQCDEMYPKDGMPIVKDVYDQPLLASDLKQIGLPVELLQYFPVIKWNFVNKVGRIMNKRWREQIDKLWSNFIEVNDEINRTYGESRKMVFENTNESNNILFDISCYTNEEIKEVTDVLDKIEKKSLISCVKKSDSNACNSKDDVKTIAVQELFETYNDVLNTKICKSISGRKGCTYDNNTLNTYTNMKKTSAKPQDMLAQRSSLIELERKVLLQNILQRADLLSAEHHGPFVKIINEMKIANNHDKGSTKRVTKESLIKICNTLDKQYFKDVVTSKR